MQLYHMTYLVVKNAKSQSLVPFHKLNDHWLRTPHGKSTQRLQ